MHNTHINGMDHTGHSRYVSSFMPQQPQSQTNYMQGQPAPPGGLYPSGGYNAGRNMAQPMNGQYNRPPGGVAPSTHLQRAGSTGSVGHRMNGGMGNLNGHNSIGGLGGQLSVGLSMANRGSNPQGHGGVLGPQQALSVGARSGSAPTAYGQSGNFAGNSGVINPMGGHTGDSEVKPSDMSAPNFGAEDFPTLGGTMGAPRSMHSEMQPGMPTLAAQKVAGIPAQDSHFQMANEDFPALAPNSMQDARAGSKDQPQSLGPDFSSGLQVSSAPMQHKPGGDPTDAKSSHGLLGLLDVIQMTSADLNTLALGTDLTTLGLNLNSTEPLYSTFASPWADAPCRREPDFALPHCYYMQPPTLKTGHVQKFQLETLFYIFYMMPKDTLQAVAASELHARDWNCLLYTSDAADEEDSVDLGGRRIIKKKKKKKKNK
eukprot:TRINITY_DN8282_c0_g1_i2.p1 TRINITY_DN8282_c0_g1~~TRINITY_DN8282_c0_g1_i2.p1  ORF type:complete len:429 (-),score=85.30 TRINITY_DN8282_c0_g1_i2:98-1384(-)